MKALTFSACEPKPGARLTRFQKSFEGFSTSWTKRADVSYGRILALKASIYGHNYNDARSGAKMADAPGQAQTAVSQGARYVTILMGANDVCTSSPSTMTSVSNFKAQFAATWQHSWWSML